MRRLLLRQHEEWYVAGQCCTLSGNEVRAPLHILYTVHGDRVATLSHRSSDGRWWHAMRFGTQRGAAEFFQRLKARYPHGLKAYEYMLRCMGGRLP